jgi:hypothetical protein
LTSHSPSRHVAWFDIDARDTLKRHSIAHHGEDTTPPSDQPEAEITIDETESISDSISIANVAQFLPTPAPANNESMSTAMSTIPFDLTAPSIFQPWDSTFDLGPDFNFGDLGTFDIQNAGPNNPWLPLRPQPDISAPFSDAQLPSPSSTGVSERWYTRLSGMRRPSRDDALLQPSAEQFREELNVPRLTSSLQQRIPDPWLPPTSFLNRTLHTYTSRLWHLIPVVHLPSFVPSRAHPLLLLSICSLGALAEGSPESLRHAFNLFEGVQKAILVAWDPNNIFDAASLAIIQAATIGQTFAMLSPKAAHLTTARAFHNTLCVSVESFQEVLKAGCEQAEYAAADGQVDGQASLIESWNEWITLQTCIRIVNALQCHDGEIAATFQRRPMLRMPPSKAMSALADSIFQLRTAIEWQEALARKVPAADLAGAGGFAHHHSVYSACAFLESVLAEIIEVRLVRSDFMQVELDRLEATLVEKSKSFVELLHPATSDKLYLKLLIHSCFIQLLCDFDHFERRIGKDGPRGSDHVGSAIVREWTGTDQGKRCVIHAASIAHAASQFRLDDVPALHVARVMYSAAVVLIVYSTSASNNVPAIDQSLPASLPESVILGNAALLFSRENVARPNFLVEHCSTLAFSLASALRCIGPWQNAQRYASTLDAVLAEHDR